MWREDRIAELLARERDTTLGDGLKPGKDVGRCAEEDDRIEPGVAARADRERTANDYGKSPEDRGLVLTHLDEVEPLLRATFTHELDASQPIEDVVAQLVRVGADPA